MDFNIVIKLLILIVKFVIIIGQNNRLNIAQGGKTLKMLFNVYRHGARAPIMSIPGDPNNDQWLQIGLGELTNVGKRQQLLNGKMTKKIYNDFLGPYYNSTQFYVQSTDFNRCVMSAQAFTTGVFPPVGEQIWTTDCLGYNWQPIPVFTTNIANDKKILSALAQKLLNGTHPNFFNRPTHKKVFEAITNATGVTNKEYASLYIDALICEIYNNDSLPFGLKVYQNDFLPIWDDVMNVVVSNQTPTIAAILLHDMMDRIQKFNNGSSTIKTNIYSMSDVHVASLMVALTDRLVGEPEFCAAIYLELYGPDNNINSDYFMLWYRKSLESESIPFKIKQCGYKCPFNTFTKIAGMIIAEGLKPM